MELTYSQSDRYCDYLLNRYPDMDAGILECIGAIAENTNWENPISSLDWNNLAVVALIEAEQSEDLEIRAMHFNNAIETLKQGFAVDGNPLCVAHYAFIQNTIAETAKAIDLAFGNFLRTLQPVYTSAIKALPGLVYLPPLATCSSTEVEHILQSENSYTQALALLSQVLWRSQLAFYSSSGVRFLELALRYFPYSPGTHLRLGVAYLMANKVEGLLNLHLAIQIDPGNAATLQALYLSYIKIGDLETANYWLEVARDLHLDKENSPELQWVNSSPDNAMTYVSFEQNMVMAVEPDFSSIVTSVLIAEGDWFEREMEFWRNRVKPGMTVIDVGANAGVYTFSAAQRVGSGGLVLAVEPFSKCVKYLKETCRVNQIDWVRVCAGAASDRNGNAKLSLSSASELNELVSEKDGANKTPGNFEEVECFTLDSLIVRENVKQVDFLKIDAEGHELQVLRGSDLILTEFKPIILYENIAASQGSNLPVADFLRNIGYRLFRYQPYLQKLIPVNANNDFRNSLNVIAIHGTSLL